MDERILRYERERAIHLLRSGRSVKEVAEILHRSEQWVRKWRRRYEAEGWDGLESRSRCPHHLTRQLPERVREATIEARSYLEASAREGELKFIGSSAVRTRLKEKGVKPLPSKRTIERILAEAHMTRRLTTLKDAGVPQYVQMDNEGCFSGGTTHPGVIGKTVRAAPMAGVEPVFSPIRHPQNQGTVERFHRTYGRHVWEGTFLEDVD